MNKFEWADDQPVSPPIDCEYCGTMYSTQTCAVGHSMTVSVTNARQKRNTTTAKTTKKNYHDHRLTPF